jgi:hypothetical protein
MISRVDDAKCVIHTVLRGKGNIMTDDKRGLEGPFDLRTLFGHAEATDAKGVARAGDAVAAGAQVDPIAERCRRMAQEVQGEQQVSANNILKPCKGELSIPRCTELQLPDIRPRFYVFWGASKCDCIESNDTEVMTIVAYNPYSNFSLRCVTANRIQVVRPDGSPVATLPDGTPSIQLTPRGPYCFGDMGPCSISYRQFVLQLRGAVAGQYRILIEGICFELCLHRMVEDCVTFEVCKD